mmetsp:Transcript_39015/g.123013  ORF Transcript_39015/g.123013 Transcript_39015/m.123013 type:complete len:179 (-) Transcript_39015:808-1344(-)
MSNFKSTEKEKLRLQLLENRLLETERHNQILMERLKKQEATLRHMDHHLPKRATTTTDLIPNTTNKGFVKQNLSMHSITEEQKRNKTVHFSSNAALEIAERSHSKFEGAKPRATTTDDSVKVDVKPIERMLIMQAESGTVTSGSDGRAKRTAIYCSLFCIVVGLFIGGVVEIFRRYSQ